MTPENTKEVMARAFHGWHNDCLKKMNPETLIREWEDLKDNEHNYWYGLVICALTVIEGEIPPAMVAAVITEMAKPVIVDDNISWEDWQGKQFTKWFKIAINRLIGEKS